MANNIDYYKAVPVLIVGDSGTGKSTSVETLPTEETVILNTEIKALPTENHDDFKVVDINTYKVLDAALRYYASEKGSKYKYLVLDSFTSMTEIIDRYTNAIYQGFDIWRNYNLLIYDVINRLKQMKQQVFVMGIPEQKAEGFNDFKSFLKVKGNELKYGAIEKEFAIVLFTAPVYDEESGEMEDVEFVYRPNKKNTAKAPIGLFTERPKNDAMFVSERINEFYHKEREIKNEGAEN
jgi:GTPase SAR1 family protein